MKEKWKDIEGYNGDYQVSNKGRVISYKQNNNGRILKPYLGTTGYRKVRLRNCDNGKVFKIARLVGIYFVDNPYNKPFINHKNGIKTCDEAWNIGY